MSIVQQRTGCHAPNAFQPLKALHQLIGSSGARVVARKHFSASSASRDSNTRERSSSPKTPRTLPTKRKKIRLDYDVGKRHRGDIVVGDLTETLERHRSTNRASVIRKSLSGPASESSSFRPALPHRLLRPWSGREEKPEERRDDVDLLFDDPLPEEKVNWFRHLKIYGRQGRSEETVQKQAVPQLIRRLDETIQNLTEPQPEDLLERTTPDQARPQLEGQSDKVVHSQAEPPPRGLGLAERIRAKNALRTLDYEGGYVAPFITSAVPATELPWVSEWKLDKLDGWARLSAEIEEFDRYMMPTAAEQATREAVIEEIQAFAANCLPHAQLEVFGSGRTGLALATSDIDLRLAVPDHRDTPGAPQPPRWAVRDQNVRHLKKLHRAFDTTKDFMLVALRHARYPLISMQHRESGIDIQIVCSNDSTTSREWIKKYLDELPGLRAIYTLVKVMFDIRGLSDVYRGGLGSYSIFMMIVASLKLAEKSESDDLSHKFMSVLDFYINLNTYKHGVAVYPPGFFEKRPAEELQTGKPRDPHLASKSGETGEDEESVEEKVALYEDSSTSEVGSLLSPLVGSSFELYEGRRKKLEAYGNAILGRDADPLQESAQGPLVAYT
ncbi:hypothetical protein H2199_000901 [Coniosporium tulheliwenetii]|uniref:Uncharacterized protein n=1 Tax=Coniosporium tulheliwenetii TaxID=3383036 RepID=A0ACC2ZNF4_9PEZI|nr:hypothetical protein H2199_000901 [Cladosporium sp. JES 115]